MDHLWLLKNNQRCARNKNKIIATFKNRLDKKKWLRLDITFLCKALQCMEKRKQWQGVLEVCTAVREFRNEHAHIDDQLIYDHEMSGFQILFKRAQSLLKLF